MYMDTALIDPGYCASLLDNKHCTSTHETSAYLARTCLATLKQQEQFFLNTCRLRLDLSDSDMSGKIRKKATGRYILL